MGSESLGWDVMYVAAEIWPEILLMMVKMLHSAQRLCILFFFSGGEDKSHGSFWMLLISKVSGIKPRLRHVLKSGVYKDFHMHLHE